MTRNFIKEVVAISFTLFYAANAITVEDFVRMRCSTDPDVEVVMTWDGAVYAVPEQQSQQKLFQLTGMNIARCLKDEDGMYWFTSRELMYYLDPETREPLSSWTNPWTKQTYPVMHVANNPVESPFGMPDDEWDSSTANGGFVSFLSDTNLFYDNPLYGNESYVDYAPYEHYEGGEYFKYFTPQAGLDQPTDSVTNETFFSWSRTSQWLPWMGMYASTDDKADTPPDGYMLYSCTGGAVASIDDLPAFMVEDINNRLPLYQHAPPCVLDIPDETSWTYFGKHFDAFLAGDKFPVEAPTQDFPCQFEPAGITATQKSFNPRH